MYIYICKYIVEFNYFFIYNKVIDLFLILQSMFLIKFIGLNII